jgi:hypothetical protein
MRVAKMRSEFVSPTAYEVLQPCLTTDLAMPEILWVFRL